MDQYNPQHETKQAASSTDLGETPRIIVLKIIFRFVNCNQIMSFYDALSSVPRPNLRPKKILV